MLSLYELWKTKPPVALILKAGLQVTTKAEEAGDSGQAGAAAELDPETTHELMKQAMQQLNI